jgi:hypothetical protein
LSVPWLASVVDISAKEQIDNLGQTGKIVMLPGFNLLQPGAGKKYLGNPKMTTGVPVFAIPHLFFTAVSKINFYFPPSLVSGSRASSHARILC